MGVKTYVSQFVSERDWEGLPCVCELLSIHTSHSEGCVCVYVCWAGREHRSTVSCVHRFTNGRVSGHQHEQVIYIPILVAVAVYVCVYILVYVCLFGGGVPSICPPPLRTQVCSCSGLKQLQQAPRPAALDFNAFSRRIFPPPTLPPRPQCLSPARAPLLQARSCSIIY